jgi:hypothetical protein
MSVTTALSQATLTAPTTLKLLGGARSPRSKQYTRPTFSSKEDEVSRRQQIDADDSANTKKSDSLPRSAYSPSSASMKEWLDTLRSEM